MGIKELLVGLSVMTATVPALAGSADVIAVKVTPTGSELYRFDVTVRHADTGWEHYADKWEVVAPDGRVFGTRTLLHPHVDEQPFTRSLGGVRIPTNVTQVFIRAHDNVDGYGQLTTNARITPPTE